MHAETAKWNIKELTQAGNFDSKTVANKARLLQVRQFKNRHD